MESEHKKSKISLSKPEDIPTEQPEYNYDSINTNEYQSSEYYQQTPPQQNYNTQYSQPQQQYSQPQQNSYGTQYSEPRRLNPNIPNSYQQTNSPVPHINSPFQNSNYNRMRTNTNTKFCKYCGSNIPFDAVVCTSCGRQVEQLNQGNYQQNNMYQQNNTYINMNNVPLSNKSRSMAGVLCVLGCFGFGGLHRFYTGHIASGILYLCTGGLFGIGTIVDLIKLLRGTFYDKNGRQLRD